MSAPAAAAAVAVLALALGLVLRAGPTSRSPRAIHGIAATRSSPGDRAAGVRVRSARAIAMGRRWAAARGAAGGGAAEVDSQILALVGALEGAVASGSTLRRAIEAVAEGGEGDGARVAAQIYRWIAVGCTVGEALDRWAGAQHAGAPRLLADALVLADRSGAGLVEALDAVADGLRDRAALRREIKALAAQGRASAAVVAVVPMVFAVGLAVLDGRVAAFFLTSAAGWACAAMGLALNAAGWWWMQLEVRRVS